MTSLDRTETPGFKERPILSIGWDVGGWVGSKQGIAVAIFGTTGIEWPGRPASFALSQLPSNYGITHFIRQAWTDAPSDILTTHRLVIAIDAPLGFPLAFTELLNQRPVPAFDPGGPEITNRLAYRATDRHIFDTLGKKPLSPSFDKLGNNATVAMVHVRRWRDQYNIPISPFDTCTPDGAVIIEVYPALAKIKGESVCYSPMQRLLPAVVTAGSDECDAAICAVLGVAFALDCTSEMLPRLVGPTDDIRVRNSSLRWIYHVPPAWLPAPKASGER
jgi:hypothetical protein